MSPNLIELMIEDINRNRDKLEQIKKIIKKCLNPAGEVIKPLSAFDVGKIQKIINE